jgi:creatinine amidohydrolase/Fe(II)-dependent formamide hydrolase-like protein
MSWAEFKDRLADPPVILMPMGAQEEQGPNAPMGDFVLAEPIADEVARRSGAVMAPVLPFGNSEFFRTLPGCMSLQPETLVAVTRDLCASLLAHGLRHLVILNGQTSNAPHLETATRRVAAAFGVMVPIIHLWRVFPAERWAKLLPAEASGAKIGHGGDPITSVYLHYFPDLVRQDLVPERRLWKQAIGLPTRSVSSVEFRGVPISMPLDTAAMTEDGRPLGRFPILDRGDRARDGRAHHRFRHRFRHTFPRSGSECQMSTATNGRSSGRESYDYLIVGAGSAGSIVAARLSEDPNVRVWLGEAGGPDRDLLLGVPGLLFRTSTSPRFNWSYQTEPEPELNNRRLLWAAGRVLGGSSTINGMLYVRGHPREYDLWRKDGCEGWSWEDVLPFFRATECNERGADALHGTDGPLSVTRGSPDVPICDLFLEAMRRAGHAILDDLNGPSMDGFGHYDRTIGSGRRQSAATAFLRPARRRPNLTIETGTTAARVIIERARGGSSCVAAAGSIACLPRVGLSCAGAP